MNRIRGMKVLHKNWGLTLGGVLILASLLVVLNAVVAHPPRGHRHLAIPTIDNPEHLARQGGNILKRLIGVGGDNFIHRLDGSIERRGRGGELIWRLSFQGLPAADQISVSDMSLNSHGQVLLTGLNSESPPEMLVVRVDVKGPFTPSVEVLVRLPEMQPASIAALDDGGFWLAALPTDEVNRALARTQRGGDFSLKLDVPTLYRYSEAGLEIGAFNQIVQELHSTAELEAVEERFRDTRLVLDGDGGLFIYRRQEPTLFRFDSRTERLSPGLPLPCHGFQEVMITGLAFAGTDVVVYSLIQTEDSLVTGYQVRALSLSTAASRLLEQSRMDEDARLAFSAVDPSTREILLFEPTRQGPTRRLPLPESDHGSNISRAVGRRYR